MSTSEKEELQEVLGELVQMWPEMIVTVIALALFVLLIVFCVKFIRHRYYWVNKENQKFGQRALRVTGDLISVNGKSRSVITHTDINGNNEYNYEHYTVVTYRYYVDGIEYKYVYHAHDSFDAEYESQHEFLYEEGRPRKAYWSEDAYKSTGKSVGCGCYICVLVTFLVILLLEVVLRLFGLN